jgi:hypothetical protein
MLRRNIRSADWIECCARLGSLFHVEHGTARRGAARLGLAWIGLFTG